MLAAAFNKNASYFLMQTRLLVLVSFFLENLALVGIMSQNPEVSVKLSDTS